MSIYSIFGKDIHIKEYGCTQEGIAAQLIPPSVNIFVKVTNGCNARCRFCSNAGSAAVGYFDIGKLLSAIEEIKDMGILVNRLNISGGEPSVVPDTVERLLEAMSPHEDIHIHLNTNGLLPESQHLMRHPRWDSISLSLHHYDICILGELYGVPISPDVLQFNGINLKKVNASCNLIRGYIDNTDEVHRMLDFAIDLGLPRIGFVSLMKVNDYCRERYVDFSEMNLEDIPHVYFTKSQNRGVDCKCSNYLYNRDAKLLEIYMRNYMNPRYCESSLVYDGRFLRQGFHSDNIII